MATFFFYQLVQNRRIFYLWTEISSDVNKRWSKKKKIVEKNTIFWRSFILSFFKKWERSYGDFLDGIKNISIMLCIFPPSFPPFFCRTRLFLTRMWTQNISFLKEKKMVENWKKEKVEKKEAIIRIFN